MKKIIITIIVAIIALTMAVKIGLLNAVFMFFLVGTIPGTQIIVPANVMLLMISTVMCVVLFYPTARNIFRIIRGHYAGRVVEVSKSPLPKRRFSEV